VIDASAAGKRIEVDGGAGNDIIRTGSMDDLIIPGGGANSVFGGAGVDTVIAQGSLRDYEVTRSGAVVTFTSADGSSFSLVDTEVVSLPVVFLATDTTLLDGRNNSPLMAPIAASVDEDTEVFATLRVVSHAHELFQPLGSFADAFLALELDGDPLTVVALNGDPSKLGAAIMLQSGAALVVNGDGSFNYDPIGQTDHLAAGEIAADTFSFTVSDGRGGSATAVVTLLVSGINDAPVAANQDVAANEGDALLIAFAADDVDSDDDQGSLTYTLLSTPSDGVVVNNGDGTFSFLPNGEFDDLAAGESRTVSFSWEAVDSHGARTGVAAVDITVAGVNDAPAQLRQSRLTRTASGDGYAGGNRRGRRHADLQHRGERRARHRRDRRRDGRIHLHPELERERRRQLHLRGERRHGRFQHGDGAGYDSCGERRAGRSRGQPRHERGLAGGDGYAGGNRRGR
jgi:VCBS repeat-containing protein